MRILAFFVAAVSMSTAFAESAAFEAAEKALTAKSAQTSAYMANWKQHRDLGPAFEARFMDNRGDILNAQGKSAEARAAYQGAMTKLAEADKAARGVEQNWQTQSNAIVREILQQKLDAVGGSK